MPLILARRVAVVVALGNLLDQDRDVGWGGGSPHPSGEQEEARNLLQEHQDLLTWSSFGEAHFCHPYSNRAQVGAAPMSHLQVPVWLFPLGTPLLIPECCQIPDFWRIWGLGV